jgi:hypothetical protein
MKIRNIVLTSAAVLFCTASMSATNAHTWVSGSGSDSNPCTFASPCATFQQALDNTTAGGIISAKDAGDFGPVSISKSVTIDGSNLGSITYSGSSDSVISIMSSSANVTVQNLTINGLGSANNGIDVTSGGTVIVDNCRIMNINEGIYFAGAGNLTVENSRIDSLSGSYAVGIHIDSSAAENVVVRNTVIDVSTVSADNANIGFTVRPATGPVNASLQNVTIMGAGAYAVEVQVGVTQITGSVLTQSAYGVYAYGATISVASSMITANTTGVYSDTGAKIRLDNNDIYDNTTAIGNGGGTVKTSGTNKVSGTIAVPAADVSESVTF